jgi:hypothetical protein
MLGLWMLRDYKLLMGLDCTLRVVSALQTLVSMDLNWLDETQRSVNAGTSFRVSMSILLFSITMLVNLGRLVNSADFTLLLLALTELSSLRLEKFN